MRRARRIKLLGSLSSKGSVVWVETGSYGRDLTGGLSAVDFHYTLKPNTMLQRGAAHHVHRRNMNVIKIEQPVRRRYKSRN